MSGGWEPSEAYKIYCKRMRKEHERDPFAPCPEYAPIPPGCATCRRATDEPDCDLEVMAGLLREAVSIPPRSGGGPTREVQPHIPNPSPSPAEATEEVV